MAKQKKQAVEAPVVEAPKHKCDVCGRDDFKSALAVAIHRGSAHKAGGEKPTPKAKGKADAPVSVTFTVPRSKLHRILDAAAELGWAELTIRF